MNFQDYLLAEKAKHGADDKTLEEWFFALDFDTQMTLSDNHCTLEKLKQHEA